MKKFLLIPAVALTAFACGRPQAIVERSDVYTRVGDVGLLVEAVEFTVANPASLRGLTAADFDLTGNAAGGFIDVKTNAAPAEYEDDGLVLSRDGKRLRLDATPFNLDGRMEGFRKRIPWELRCSADSALTATLATATERHIAVLDDCITGSFTFAGITREYMLHLPKDADGQPIPNVPLLVWQIGGGEYDKDLMTVATANRCLVSLATEGIPCAALVFAIANPNYSYSASLHPEKIELIDRNNALQMAFIDTLIAEGKVDGSRLFCAGASSGGGCTMRFMMQFPDRFKAAIPCCPMDPIVPIHQVQEQYEGQFAADLVKAFQGQVYKWNGTDMAPAPIDTRAFVKLPMYFVHASSDRTCKIASSYSYIEARKRLGAREDLLRVYSDEDMAAYGLPTMLAHFSWVPLLDDYSEDSVMQWMIRKF
ncbi:MAG: prolyl oligopeptidase family serine peptidase [Bacteroidales bacterium]|nr:prolyl oligopeptidase family serine peptidase [Bacteroidales bacterium]